MSLETSCHWDLNVVMFTNNAFDICISCWKKCYRYRWDACDCCFEQVALPFYHHARVSLALCALQCVEVCPSFSGLVKHIASVPLTGSLVALKKAIFGNLVTVWSYAASSQSTHNIKLLQDTRRQRRSRISCLSCHPLVCHQIRHGSSATSRECQLETSAQLGQTYAIAKASWRRTPLAAMLLRAHKGAKPKLSPSYYILQYPHFADL